MNVKQAFLLHSEAVRKHLDGDLEGAICHYRQCVDHMPTMNRAQAQLNFALALQSAGQYEQAQGWFSSLLHSHVGHEASFNLALTLMHQSRLKEGMEFYRWRVGRQSEDGVPFPPLPLPYWDGVDHRPHGNVLVLNEQGLGDEILFLRALPWWLEQLSSKDEVVVQLYKSVAPLVEQNKTLFPTTTITTDRSFSKELIGRFSYYTSTGAIFIAYCLEHGHFPPQLPWTSGRPKLEDVGSVISCMSRPSRIMGKKSLPVQVLVDKAKVHPIVSFYAKHPSAVTATPESFLDTLQILESAKEIIAVESAVASLCASTQSLHDRWTMAVNEHRCWRWNFDKVNTWQAPCSTYLDYESKTRH